MLKRLTWSPTLEYTHAKYTLRIVRTTAFGIELNLMFSLNLYLYHFQSDNILPWKYVLVLKSAFENA